MYCGSVKVVCEYNGSIVDKKGNVIVVCEYCEMSSKCVWSFEELRK